MIKKIFSSFIVCLLICSFVPFVFGLTVPEYSWDGSEEITAYSTNWRGTLYYTDADFDSCINAEDGESIDYGNLYIGTKNDSGTYTTYRSFAGFVVPEIPADASITNVTLSVYMHYKGADADFYPAVLYDETETYPLGTIDLENKSSYFWNYYETYLDSESGASSVASWSNNAYNNITLDAATCEDILLGLGEESFPNNVFKFMLIDWDQQLEEEAPEDFYEQVICYAGGGTYPPKLFIEWEITSDELYGACSEADPNDLFERTQPDEIDFIACANQSGSVYYDTGLNFTDFNYYFELDDGLTDGGSAYDGGGLAVFSDQNGTFQELITNDADFVCIRIKYPSDLLVQFGLEVYEAGSRVSYDNTENLACLSQDFEFNLTRSGIEYDLSLVHVGHGTINLEANGSLANTTYRFFMPVMSSLSSIHADVCLTGTLLAAELDVLSLELSGIFEDIDDDGADWVFTEWKYYDFILTLADDSVSNMSLYFVLPTSFEHVACGFFTNSSGYYQFSSNMTYDTR